MDMVNLSWPMWQYPEVPSLYQSSYRIPAEPPPFQKPGTLPAKPRRDADIRSCTVKVLRSCWLKASTEVFTTMGVSTLTSGGQSSSKQVINVAVEKGRRQAALSNYQWTESVF